MPWSIRRTTREDADAVLELIDALARFEELAPPDGAARARLVEHGWCERPRFDTWLAEDGGKPVGYAFAFETYSSFLARPILYLEDLFVLPEYRGQGVGKGLFRVLVQEAEQRGCGRMEWVCLDWNTRAQAFYDGIGARNMREWYPYRLTHEAMQTYLAATESPDIDAA